MGWDARAASYGETEWVQSSSYLDTFLSSVQFSRHDRVLDVGVGTGVVLRAIQGHVALALGLDLSLEMLDVAGSSGLKSLVMGNVAHLPFPSGAFDKVLARMVWHHLVGTVAKATAECYRVLRPGGLMVLSEGVPPHPSLQRWYSRMFKLKERRLTFLPEELAVLMEAAGFEVISTWECVLARMSVGDWLDKSRIRGLRKAAILWMHRFLSAKGKSYYNMAIERGNVYCDFKFVGVVGKK